MGVISRTFWLDMDGVLVDFCSAACRLHGFDPEAYPPNVWDMPSVLGITPEEFYRPMTAKWWSFLKPTPECDILRDLLRRQDVRILTSPHDHRSRRGKAFWAMIQWPGVPVVFAHYEQKPQYAGPGQVLLDDCDRNIEAWRAAGGVGILMPRRWNSGWREPNARRALETLLDYCYPWMAIAAIGRAAGDAVDVLPTDLAARLDEYLYGRNEGDKPTKGDEV